VKNTALTRRPIDRRGAARTSAFPAPVRGLNFKDSIAGMQPTDALQLDNLFCQPGFVEIRKGSQTHSTGASGVSDAVSGTTLVPYISTSGVLSLFLAADSGMWDVTASVAALTGATVTNGYGAYTQVSNVAGNFLFFVNGTDTELVYNGAAWASWGFTGPVAGSIKHLAVWKRRVWAVQENSMISWYGAVDAISGAMTQFNLSGIFRKGGRLLSILNWTVDGGDGVDDYLLFVTTEGEVALYRGTDPSAAATFALVGVYFIGRPVGERYYSPFGGDVLMLTENGVIAFSRFLQSATVDRDSFLSDRISVKLNELIALYGTLVGWELHAFFPGNALILQLPVSETTEVEKTFYVMNLTTLAWSRFTTLRGESSVVAKGALYFVGGDYTVYRGWTNGLDGTSSIKFTLVTAFSYFGGSARRKRFTMFRPTVEVDIALTLTTAILLDFNREWLNPGGSVPPAAALSAWDTAVWDSDLWGAGISIQTSWRTVGGVAYSAAGAVMGYSRGAVCRLISFDYVYEVGGLL
jgi:hypothetical protein